MKEKKKLRLIKKIIECQDNDKLSTIFDILKNNKSKIPPPPPPPNDRVIREGEEPKKPMSYRGK